MVLLPSALESGTLFVKVAGDTECALINVDFCVDLYFCYLEEPNPVFKLPIDTCCLTLLAQAGGNLLNPFLQVRIIGVVKSPDFLLK